LLLIGIIFVNATNYFGFFGVAGKSSPYETTMYNTLTIPLIYCIDILIGSKIFSWMSLLFLSLIIFGVMLLLNFSFRKITFKKSLLIALFSSIAKGYLLHFFLQYASFSAYMLLVHIITVILLLLVCFKQVKSHPITHWKWAFTTQAFGTVSLLCNAMLAQNSVSAYSLRGPATLVLITLFSFFVKNKAVSEKPTIQKMVAILLCVIGMVLFQFYGA